MSETRFFLMLAMPMGISFCLALDGLRSVETNRVSTSCCRIIADVHGSSGKERMEVDEKLKGLPFLRPLCPP